MIKAILHSYNSKRDKFGNCYWAFTWTDCQTDKSVSGTVCGGESNVRAIIREMGLDWQTCHYSQVELPIREFNRMVKGWPYAGCTPDELKAFIKGQQ